MTRTILSVTTLFVFAVPLTWADDLKVDKPQSAALLTASGKTVKGTLVSLKDGKIEFQVPGVKSTSIYPAGTVKAIQFVDGTIHSWNADKKTFETGGKVETPKPENPGGKEPTVVKPEPKAELTEDATQTVIAKGQGKTLDDALKDAFRNAVSQAVGVFVDQETIVKNDELISDKVLTYSAAFVAGYDKLSDKEESGLVKVEIRARVERRKLTERLKANNISVREVGGKDLAAAAITRAEARKNATELLTKRLADIPKLLTAEVRKFNEADYDEDARMLTVDVSIKADLEKYAQFAKQTEELLDKISLSKDFLIVQAKVEESNFFHDRKGPEFFVKEPGVLAGTDTSATPKVWSMWILSNTDKQFLRSRWNVYFLDSNPAPTLESLRGRLSSHLEFLDENGKVIAEEDFALTGSNRSTSPWLMHAASRRKNGQISADSTSVFEGPGHYDSAWAVTEQKTVNAYIAPLAYQIDKIEFYLPYAPSMTYRKKVSMTVQELRKVKRTQCTVLFRPAQPAKDE